MKALGTITRAYAAASAAWLAGLAALVLAQTALVRLPGVATWSGIEFGWHLSAATTALMPFVAFAGGAAVARWEPMGSKALAELAAVVCFLAATFYIAAGFVVPRIWYDRDAARGVDVGQVHPFGPPTVVTMLERRAHALASPPSSYSHSIERPLDRPPNWLTYMIHRDGAFAVFAVLNSFLGLLAARALARDGPRYRRRKLWAAGLASGLVLLVTMRVAREVVFTSLTVSGVAMAWLPLVIPVAAIVWLSLGPARPALVQERPVAGEKARV